MNPFVLIVPCYNEANRIDKEAWLSACGLFETIIFVDDGSTDNTTDVLETLVSESKGQNLAQLQLISLESNQGKAEAIRQGVLKCDQYLSSESLIGYCDADLSTPLHEMRRLFEVCQVEQAELILGSRVKLAGFNVQRSGIRHYLGRLSATLICLLLKITIYDTQAGAKVFASKHKKRLFAESFVSRWLFDCEIILRANQAEILIREEPLRTWLHHDSDSKINPNSYFKSLIDLIQIRRKYIG